MFIDEEAQEIQLVLVTLKAIVCAPDATVKDWLDVAGARVTILAPSQITS